MISSYHVWSQRFIDPIQKSMFIQVQKSMWSQGFQIFRNSQSTTSPEPGLCPSWCLHTSNAGDGCWRAHLFNVKDQGSVLQWVIFCMTGRKNYETWYPFVAVYGQKTHNSWSAFNSGFVGYSRPWSAGIRLKSSSENAGINQYLLSVPNTWYRQPQTLS